MTEIQMIQTEEMSENSLQRLFLSLDHLIFEFVSHFDIRISNLVNHICLDHALWAYLKAGPSGPGFFT